jgi:hypothetical protein
VNASRDRRQLANAAGVRSLRRAGSWPRGPAGCRTRHPTGNGLSSSGGPPGFPPSAPAAGRVAWPESERQRSHGHAPWRRRVRPVKGRREDVQKVLTTQPAAGLSGLRTCVTDRSQDLGDIRRVWLTKIALGRGEWLPSFPARLYGVITDTRGNAVTRVGPCAGLTADG